MIDIHRASVTVLLDARTIARLFTLADRTGRDAGELAAEGIRRYLGAELTASERLAVETPAANKASAAPATGSTPSLVPANSASATPKPTRPAATNGTDDRSGTSTRKPIAGGANGGSTTMVPAAKASAPPAADARQRGGETDRALADLAQTEEGE